MVHVSSLVIAVAVASTASVLAAPQYGQTHGLEARARTKNTARKSTGRAPASRPPNRRPGSRTDWAKVVNGVVQGVRDQGIIPQSGSIDPTALADPNGQVRRSLGLDELEERDFEDLEARTRKARKPSPRTQSRRPPPRTDWVKVVNGVVQGVRDQGIIPQAGSVDPALVDPAQVTRSLERRNIHAIEARARKSRKASPKPKSHRPGPRTDWAKVVNGVVQGVRDQGIIPQAGGVVDPSLADPNMARSLVIEKLDERNFEDIEGRDLLV